MRATTTLLILIFSFAISYGQVPSVQQIVVAPLALNDSILLGKNQSRLIDVLFNDSDPDNNIDSNSIQVVGAPQLGIFQVINKKISYTPSTNVCGQDSIKYRIRDLNNEVSNIATVYITITCFNLPPIAENDSLILDEDSRDSINVFDNDSFEDGPEIIITIAEQAKNGVASIGSAFVIHYEPNPNFFGLDSILYSFCDADQSDELCDSAYIYIRVRPINDPPIAINETINVYQGISSNFNLNANDSDIDGPEKIYTIIINPSNGLSNLSSSGIISYTSNNTFIGRDSLFYSYCDNGNPNLCDSAYLFINVQEVFKLPIAINDTLVVKRNSTNNRINILKNDSSFYGLNSDSIVFLNSALNGNFSYDDSTITYTPNNNFIGEEIIQYRFKNTIDSSSNIASILIRVNTQARVPDQCPIINISGQSNTIFVQSNSIPGNKEIDDNFILINRAPLHGTLGFYNPINQSIAYISDQNYTGLDSFTYVLRDIDGLQTESIKVCIQVESDINVQPINVLSPNGDGINDRFEIADIDNYPDNELIIFDRNANELFRTKNYSSSKFWVPDNVLNGTYFYILTIRLNNTEKKFKGYFTIYK